ncbi:MAG: PepSY domain-containing protein [Tibeticola sp.]
MHFWAGLIGAPIVLFAAITGLVYVFTPQIESQLYGSLDRVQVGQRLVSLDTQIAAAQAVVNDRTLRFVVPPHRPEDSTQVYFNAAHRDHDARAGGQHNHGLPAGHIVYVNPYTGEVLGQLPELQRFKTWAKKLHSSALQGDGWRWVIELGASWMLVLYVSGLVLWWPRAPAQGGRGWRSLVPRLGRGRASWRDGHAVVAIVVGLVTVTVLVTGLTWSRHTGARFRAMQQVIGQDAPKPPKLLTSAPGDGPALSWQAAWEHARQHAPDIAMQITAPGHADGVWRVENFDRSQPSGRFSLALDGRTGAPLFAAGWEQFPVLARATAVGIPFHRGEFGLWNQIVLALAALAAAFSVVSGLVMWWQRRPKGRIAAPPLGIEQLRYAPLWLIPLMVALSYAMPVFGWSLIVLVTLESVRLAWPRQRGAHIFNPERRKQ